MKTIAVIGGGQLCLMMAQAIRKKNMPYRLIAVDPSPNCPARPYLDELITGDYKDETKIRQLAQKADLITFEIELASSGVLHELSKKGMSVHPSPDVLQIIQDKYVQARFLEKKRLPIPEYMHIEDNVDLEKAITYLGLPVMIKSRKDSYDGRGNFILRSAGDLRSVFSYFGRKPLMAQKFIPFETEISVIVARNIHGAKVTFPVGENIHGKDYNILQKTILPARVPESVIDEAKMIAENAVESLKGVGVFGIEMFVTQNRVLINEIAPRVHNTGHFSIEACATSQFEQHIRAITGSEFGDTHLITDSAVMYNIIGGPADTGEYEILFDGMPVQGILEIDAGAFIHHYHKAIVKPYRKMGHLTMVANNNESRASFFERSEKLYKKIKIVAGKERIPQFPLYKAGKSKFVPWINN